MAFPLNRPARIAVFASGRGSNLRSLAAAFPRSDPLGGVVLVVSDNEDAPALDYAREVGIAAAHVAWTTRLEFEQVTRSLLEEYSIDLVCLAGFMRMLSAEFVDELAGLILNVHPSLLPRHRGLNPHRKVLEAGDAETGCSVHFVDAGMDTGKVIGQRRLPVLPRDTEESLAARVLERELDLYPDAVRKVLRGEVRP